MLFRVMVALIAVFLSLGAAQAQSERRVALIVGNDHYTALGNLKNAGNDADAVAAKLTSLGFAVTPVRNGDRAGLLKSLRAFREKARGADLALVFYAGHGIQSGGQNYLLPADIDINDEVDLPETALALDRLTDQLQDGGAKRTLIIWDACRDNPLLKRFSDSARSAGRSAGLGRGLAVVGKTPPETVVWFSADSGQIASDGEGRNSPFTGALLAALDQPGLTSDDVFRQIARALKGQSPKPYGIFTEPVVFHPGAAAGGVPATAATPSAAPAPSVDPGMVEFAYWQSAEKSGTLGAYEAYARKYPHGQFIDLAKAKLEELKPKVKVEAASVVAPAAPVAAVHGTEPRVDRRAPGTVFRDAPGLPEMVVIPAGRFTMGSTSGETSREGVPDADANWEHPQHEVSVGAFALGKVDVTVGEYGAFVAETGYGDGQSGCFVYDGKAWNNDATKSWRNPGFSQSDRSPVVCVSYKDAQAYVRWLNGKVRSSVSVSTGSGDGPYRLPSEAEWEYAARAGTTTARWWGEEIGSGNAVCGSCGSQWDGKSTSPVGSFRPNPYGLYDVLGNVWQWTDDCWVENYFGAPADGRANSSGDCGKRVVRGGSWFSSPRTLRSARRNWIGSGVRSGSIGFRVARTLP